MIKQEKLPDLVNLLLGVGLFVSPWAFGFTNLNAASWNAWLSGALIAALAAAALWLFAEWEEWLTLRRPMGRNIPMACPLLDAAYRCDAPCDRRHRCCCDRGCSHLACPRRLSACDDVSKTVEGGLWPSFVEP